MISCWKVMLTGMVFAAGAMLATAEEVNIYRDTWGVPHVYAQSAAGAAFGTGYAQAEDRLEDIYRNIRTAVGKASEAFGEEHLETDYIMSLLDNAKKCEAYYPSLPENLRAILESYIAGIQAYEKEHPEKRPAFAIDLHPWQPLCVGRAMVLRWPLDTLMDDMKNKPDVPPFGSNAFAVAPERSADGCPILLTDPHQTWASLALFWEGRVRGGELNMNGFFIVGSPLVGLGHNDHVGWAMTTGGPDTSDVYMLKLNPAMPMQYEYNGEWKTAELKMLSIPVKGEDKPREMPALYTMHGPLLGEPDFEHHVAYAGKTPYADDMGVFEQMYAMAISKDAKEFYDALAKDHLMEQNIVYADRQGNIGYVRVGRTPMRPEGYDWTAPVPGWTSEAEWKGIHPMSDHVQILNPPQGYMQNCNVSPRFMMEDSPMTADKYPVWVYNEVWDKDNPRGKRMRQLLSEKKQMTKEDAMAIAMDLSCPTSDNWMLEVVRAVNERGGQYMADSKFADAAVTLMSWKSDYRKELRAPVFMWKLRELAKDKLDCDKISTGGKLNPDEQDKLLATLKEAVEEIAKKYDVHEVTWGDIFKVGRSGRYFPADGADFGKGDSQTATVRNVRYEETPKGSGQYVANYGSLAAMLMFMKKDGIESYTCTQWGQSADPNSPHHVDQAKELFSKRQFKPTWNTLEEVKDNLESEKKLQTP